jgi:hypothetical protein
MKLRSLVRWLSMIGVTTLVMVETALAADVHVMISAGVLSGKWLEFSVAHSPVT